MEGTLEVLNQLEAEGVISRYAIGGAVGAIFYMEPFLTYDLDVFVFLPQTAGGLLTLSPIYEALKQRGFDAEGECVQIKGMPVQFLPAYNPLLEEALEQARDESYADTRARVLRPEHLAAIMVQTGRDKDRQRFTTFMEEAPLDAAYLQEVLTRHQLTTRFNAWKPTS
ncbi:MAG: hypothetical protein LW645_06665 [Verrucomicrobiaceae bacterium]|jgi:hypothetical protein|nr:hypothetical protein [Verrucomicrobiaceae bacterium]